MSIQPPRIRYELRPGDELCFECPLEDCDETDPLCPRHVPRPRKVREDWLANHLAQFRMSRIVDRAEREVIP